MFTYEIFVDLHWIHLNTLSMEKLTIQEEEAMLYIWELGSCEYKRSFMSGFVRNYFENSYKEMVSFFAKDQKISANDLKDIIDMIEKGKE